MKPVLVLLSTLVVIGTARLTLRPSPRRDITFPRHVQRADPEEEPQTVIPRTGEEKEKPTKMPPLSEGSAAKLRVSGSRRKKVKKVSTRENETTSVTNSSSSQARKLHTKIIHVPEPFVVHVDKPYPVYIEKPIIVEKHIPVHLYITKKESKHR